MCVCVCVHIYTYLKCFPFGLFPTQWFDFGPQKSRCCYNILADSSIPSSGCWLHCILSFCNHMMQYCVYKHYERFVLVESAVYILFFLVKDMLSTTDSTNTNPSRGNQQMRSSGISSLRMAEWNLLKCHTNATSAFYNQKQT